MKVTSVWKNGVKIWILHKPDGSTEGYPSWLHTKTEVKGIGEKIASVQYQNRRGK